MKRIALFMATVMMSVSVFSGMTSVLAEEVPSPSASDSPQATSEVTVSPLPTETATVTPVPTPTSLIKNPGFEDGTDEWNFDENSGEIVEQGNNSKNALKIKTGKTLTSKTTLSYLNVGKTYALRADIALVAAPSNIGKGLMLRVTARGKGQTIVLPSPTPTATVNPTEEATETPTVNPTEEATETPTVVPTETATPEPVYGPQEVIPSLENTFYVKANNFAQNDTFVTFEKKITLAELKDLVGSVDGKAFDDPYFQFEIVCEDGTFLVDNIRLTELSIDEVPSTSPEPTETDEPYTYKIRYYANKNITVRNGAATKYAKYAIIAKGTQIKVTGLKGKWYEINYKGRTKYIMKTNVKVKSTWYMRTTAKVNIRKSASIKSQNIGSYKKGKYLKISQIYKGFGKVSGENKWVSMKYLRTNANKPCVYIVL